MQQFYSVSLKDENDVKTVHFIRPVRKIKVNVLTSTIACSIGTRKNGNKMLLLGVNTPGFLDFQSANTGKSVQDLTFWRFSGSGTTTVTISIVEYGSDGDNTYFE